MLVNNRKTEGGKPGSKIKGQENCRGRAWSEERHISGFLATERRTTSPYTFLDGECVEGRDVETIREKNIHPSRAGESVSFRLSGTKTAYSLPRRVVLVSDAFLAAKNRDQALSSTQK